MIINKTKKIILEKEYKYCNNPLSQLKGLMFSKPKTLIFDFKKEKKISLHMFFVFFSIYVLFLNNKKEVIEIKKLKPFTFYNSKKLSRYIIEFPYKKLDKNNINIGDKIEF